MVILLLSLSFLNCGPAFNKAQVTCLELRSSPGLIALSQQQPWVWYVIPISMCPVCKCSVPTDSPLQGTESIWGVLFHCISFPEVPGIFYEHRIVLGTEYFICRKQKLQACTGLFLFLFVLFFKFPHYMTMLFLRCSDSIHSPSDIFSLEGYSLHSFSDKSNSLAVLLVINSSHSHSKSNP